MGFVVTHTSSGSPGSIVRVRELSRSLASMGVGVHVYSPYSEPDWGEGVHLHKMPSLADTLGLQDVSYRQMRRIYGSRLAPIFLGRTFLEPVIGGLSKQMRRYAERDALDVLQGEQEIAAAACTRLRGKIRAHVFSSMHNVWLEELVASGVIEASGREYPYLEGLEEEIASGPDAVVVVSRALKDYIRERFSRDEGVVVVPPGGRLRVDAAGENPPPFRIVYAGLVEKRANLDLLVNSAARVRERLPDARFFVTDRGEELGRIKALAKRVGAPVSFYWYPDGGDFYRFLASCHLGVLTSSNDLPRVLGPAVKLYDYLSVGLPVVGNDIGGWTRVVEEEGLGRLTVDDPEEFADAIVEMLLDADRRRIYSRSAIDFVRKNDWDASARILLGAYDKVT